MKIELSKIPNNGLVIDSDVTLDKELYKDIVLDIKDLHVNGIIDYDYEGSLIINLDVNGKFLLNDANTLEEILYPFSCKIEENIADIENKWQDFYEKSKNILDISEILWENIVLEVPIRVSNTTSEELSLKGDGWELKNENEEKIDPRLEKLKELFEDGKE